MYMMTGCIYTVNVHDDGININKFPFMNICKISLQILKTKKKKKKTHTKKKRLTVMPMDINEKQITHKF